MTRFNGRRCLGRSLFVLFMLCCAPPGWLTESAAAPHDRHHLKVQLDLQRKALSVSDEIVFGSPCEEPVVLGIHPRARNLVVQMSGEAIAHSVHSGRLELSLPPELRSGAQHLTLSISYTAVFDDPVPDDPVSFDNPGFGVTGTITAQGCFLLSGAGWYPRTVGRTASILLEVSAPRGILAVTAGRLVKHEDSESVSLSVWEIDHLVEGLSLSAAPYVVRSRDRGGISIYTYFLPDTDHLSDRYLDASAAHLEFYESLFGPYPFPKFAVVENFFPTGYGFPSYTLLGTSVLQLPFIPETSLKHEVAHSWWGNGVLVDPNSGNWCEGLTTYVADYLSQELKSVGDGQAYRRQILQDFTTLADSDEDFPLAHFVGRTSPSSRAVGYGKAAFVFHMIRLRLGESAFWGALRRVYRERLFKESTWEDFRRVFSEMGNWDSGESRRFFDQWIRRAGAPSFRLQDVRSKQDNQWSGWLTEGAVSQSEDVYGLRVPLELETTEGSERLSVSLEGASATFSIRSAHRPKRLVVDPETTVFRRLAPEEVPPTVNSVKSSRELKAVLATSTGPSFRETFELLLQSLNQENVPIIREENLKLSDVVQSDLIFFGSPQSSSMDVILPSKPHGLVLSSRGYSFAGLPFGSPGDCLFVVVKDPARQGRLTALFNIAAGTSAESVSMAVRKITHYGKYSALSFLNGTNQQKLIWPTLSSPLIVNLEETP